MKRLLEERNAVLYEYSRVMAERDTVHKEIDQLQEDLAVSNEKCKTLQTENVQLSGTKKKLEHQVEALKIEIQSALHDRDLVLKELHDKCFPEKHFSPSGSWKFRESLKDNDLRQEEDQLKKHLQKTRIELEAALQEARMSEKRKDWALNERDQAIRERDSIRILCDELRRERDRALSEMARVLRNSDDIQRQLQQTFVELKELRQQLVDMQLETKIDQECRSIDHSDDSAVGSADLTMDETETVKVELDYPKGMESTNFGFALGGGNDPGSYVVSVTNGGSAEGKLKINDRIIKVGDVSCTSVDSETVWNVLRSAEMPIVLTLKRQKRKWIQGLHSVKIESGRGLAHGLTFENGLYIQSVAPGSAASRSHLRNGDRVYSINGRIVDSISSRSAYQLMDDTFRYNGGLIVTVFRGSPFSSTLPMPSSPGSRPTKSEDRFTALSAKTGRRTSICQSQTEAEREADAIAALENVIDSYNPPHLARHDEPDDSTIGRQWTRRGLFRRSEALLDMSKSGNQRHNVPRSWPRRRNSGLPELFNTCNHPRARWPLSVFIEAFKVSSKANAEESGVNSANRIEVSDDHSTKATEIVTDREERNKHRTSINKHHSHSHNAEVSSYGDWTSRSEPFSGTSRIRIPPNSSLPSSGSYAGRISAGGGMGYLERDNTVPSFRVEVIRAKRSEGGPDQRKSSIDAASEAADCCSSTEEVRRIWIEKCSIVGSLGFQIFSGNSVGGVFVSSVHRSSLAAQVGLRVGDQILEVCGINIRTATYEQAAQILRHCGGDSLTLLVQYNPDKYFQQDLTDYHNRELRIGSPSLTLKGSSSLSNKCSSVDRIADTDSRVSSRDTVSAVESQMEARPSLNCSREPRTIHLSTRNSYGLNGISLVGGNRVGIYIHSVESNSSAFEAGLRTGDRILEYNGIDLREATAEKAAYELGKSTDNVKMIVQSDPERHKEIADQSGDGFYIRSQFDRQVTKEADNQQVNHLSFRRHDILYVDNTMFNGVPGQWRAWLIDEQGKRTKCGLIPSKYKVDEEVLHRPGPKAASQENEARRSLTRRSFSRWKLRFSRTSWRDSKDISNYEANLHMLGRSSEEVQETKTESSAAFCRSYVRVDRLNRRQVKRPVLIMGPLSNCVVDKLVGQYSDRFVHGAPDMLRTTLSSSGSSPVKLHPTWSIGPSSLEPMEFLLQQSIHPIVLFLKFKSAKQIRRLADMLSTSAKPVTDKVAKEMYQSSVQMEVQRKNLITVVIPISDALADISTRVRATVKQEQKRIMWITLGSVPS